MLTQSLLCIGQQSTVHTLSDNGTGTGRGGSYNTLLHITSHHIHNVSVFILSQPHTDSLRTTLHQPPTKINKGFCYRYNTHGRSHTWSQARSYSNCGKYLDKKQTNIKCYWQRPSVSPSMIFTPLKRISIGVKKYRNPDKFFNVILKISTSWTWIVLHSWAFLYFPLY